MKLYPEMADNHRLCVEERFFEYCHDLGVFALSKNDKFIAQSYLNMACEAEHAESCTKLAKISGSELQRNQYLHSGCYLGDYKACDELVSYHGKTKNLIQQEKYGYLSCFLKNGKEFCGKVPVGL